MFLKTEKKNQYHMNKAIITKIPMCVFLVFFVTTINPVFADSQQQAQEQIDQLNAQNQAAQQQISSLDTQQNTLSNQIALLNAQINQLQIQINEAQAEVSLTDQEITNTDQQIAQANANLAQEKVVLGQYLRTMYMESQVSTIELIAESNSFSDFVDKSEYMSTMQQSVQGAADKIVALTNQLNLKKYSLQVEQARAQELQSQTLSQQSLIGIQRNQESTLLQETQGSEASYKTLIANNNAQMGVLHCVATGGCQSSPNGNLVAINIPLYYNQTASPWSSYVYDAPYTIGEDGCLITSLAMVDGINPIAEAQKHTFSDGYMEGTWGQNITGNWTAINEALAEGKPVIVGLDLDSYGDTHFVLIKSTSNGKYYINDPYFPAGHTYNTSQIFEAAIPN
jgi:peptidoglycan hydrolase CwlO-like protein